jgi:hypothetical protein
MMPPGTVSPFVMRFDTGSVPVGHLVLSSPTRMATYRTKRYSKFARHLPSCLAFQPLLRSEAARIPSVNRVLIARDVSGGTHARSYAEGPGGPRDIAGAYSGEIPPLANRKCIASAWKNLLIVTVLVTGRPFRLGKTVVRQRTFRRPVSNACTHCCL